MVKFRFVLESGRRAHLFPFGIINLRLLRCLANPLQNRRLPGIRPPYDENTKSTTLIADLLGTPDGLQFHGR
jgi:hypothetical protein